jgi:hypothetical protein
MTKKFTDIRRVGRVVPCGKANIKTTLIAACPQNVVYASENDLGDFSLVYVYYF